jgi:hypothetical protein
MSLFKLLSQEVEPEGFGAPFIKVISPNWAEAPLLLLGSTARSGWDHWSVSWQHGGQLPSSVALKPVE